MSNPSGMTYLGDAVWAGVDQWGMLTLTADPGTDLERSVHLEPEVYASLVAYMTERRRGQP